MEIFNHRIYTLKLNKQIAWLLTIGLMVAGLPFLKAAITYFVKLMEMFIQQGFVN